MSERRELTNDERIGAHRAWRACRVPARHRAVIEGKTYQPTRIVTALAEIVRAGGMAALIGPRGCGKTQDLVALAAHWCYLRTEEYPPACVVTVGEETNPCRQVIYTRLSDMDAELRDEVYANKVGLGAWRDRYTGRELLLIDELNEVSDKQAGQYGELQRHLTAIIDTRYGDMRPTVLSLNSSADSLVGYLGSSIVDRVRETGTVIEMPNKNLRAPKQGKAGATA